MSRPVLRVVLVLALFLWPLAVAAQNPPPGGPPPGQAKPPGQSTPPGQTGTLMTPGKQNQSGPPALRGFSPTQGTQGTSVTLTFTGINFRSPIVVQFDPPAGLTATANVLNPNQVQAQVQIDAAAPLGPRHVTLRVGDFALPAQMPFTVLPGQQQPCATPAGIAPLAGVPCPAPPSGQPGNNPPPREKVLLILRVTPNQVAAGSQSVDLKIEGRNFAPGAQVGFGGTGVFPIGAVQFVNDTEIHVTVNVIPLALPGGRDVSVTDPNKLSGTGKGLLNVTAPKPPVGPSPRPNLVKLTPIAFQPFTEGVIELDQPEWGDRWHGEFEDHYGIPMFDDEVVFKWHEKNPGLAEYYELRIYAKDGKTILAKKEIDGEPLILFGQSLTLVPTYFRPDPAFLADLLSKVPPPQRSLIFNQIQVQLLGGGGAGQPPPPPSPSAPKLSDGDMQWEVAGYRTYNKNGGKKQAGAKDSQTDLEVEISERWPLGRPKAPTGLDCSGTGFGTGLNVTDVADQHIYDEHGHDTGKLDPNPYVGDPWVLSGKFDLSRSPYASHPGILQGPRCDGCLFGPIQQFQFDNLFVDWGDGHIEKLNAPPGDSAANNWNRNEGLTLPQSATDPNAVKHSFDYPGNFTVRVFQLSEEDLQQVNVSLVAGTVDGANIHPYMQALTLASLGGSSATSAGKGSVASMANMSAFKARGPSAADVAKRAFMIYCHTVNVSYREDTAADGPLHLKSIDDPDFPGHDVQRGGAGLRTTGLARTEMLAGAKAASSETARPALPTAAQRSGGTGSMVAGGPDAICSTCDESLLATSNLWFHGRGKVKITWHLDSGALPSSAGETLEIGPSEQRKGLGRPGTGAPEPPIIDSSAPLTSPALAVGAIGNHIVSVEAEVVPEPKSPSLSIAVQGALSSLLSPVSSGGSSTSAVSGGAMAKAVLDSLAPPPGSGLPPLKVGLLSPSNAAAPGMPAVQYVNSTLAQALSQIQVSAGPTDQHVYSGRKTYQVLGADASQPCTFLFPVKSGGAFHISGLQGKVKKQPDGKWIGTGNLIIHLATDTGYQQYPPISVKIDGWDVPDAQNVKTGSFDVSPKQTLDAATPGLKGTVDWLVGTAGDKVDATLSVQLSDNTLRLPGLEKPAQWAGVSAPLSPEGDWLKDGLTLPPTLIGWSQFQMQSSNVRLDLSHSDGDAAGPLCGSVSQAKDWAGIRLVSATIIPYTMDLVSPSSLQP